MNLVTKLVSSKLLVIFFFGQFFSESVHVEYRYLCELVVVVFVICHI